MGKFTDYYNQIKTKMAGPPPLTLENAVAALQAQQRLSAPREGEALERYNYTQMCNNAIMYQAALKLQREAAWDTTVQHIGTSTNQPGLQVPKGSGDWLVNEMKTDGSMESQVYNEKIVGQMALCTKRISREQFVDIRQNRYTERDGGRITNESTASIFQEMGNPQGQLLDALDQQIQRAQQQMDAIQQSVNIVFGLQANQEALNQAFGVIESPDINTLHNAQNCLEEFKTFDSEYQPAEDALKERQEAWPAGNKEQVDTLRENAEGVGDQFYNDLKQEAPAEQEQPKEAPVEEDQKIGQPPIKNDQEDQKEQAPAENKQEEAKQEAPAEQEQPKEAPVEEDQKIGQPPIKNDQEDQKEQAPAENKQEEAKQEAPAEQEQPKEAPAEKDQKEQAPAEQEQEERKAPEQQPQSVPEPQPVPAQKAPQVNQAAQDFILKREAIDAYLKPYGLEADNQSLQNGSGYRLYQNAEGASVILRADKVTAPDGSVTFQVHDDAPGHYINYDLDQRLNTTVLQCKLLENDDGRPHSKEYNALNDAAQALTTLHLADQPDPAEVKRAVNLFARFKFTLGNFIREQSKRPLRVDKKDWYDRTISDLSIFSQQKNFAINAVDDHLETMAQTEREKTAPEDRHLDSQELNDALKPPTAADIPHHHLFSSPEAFMGFSLTWMGTMGATVNLDWDKRRKTAWEYKKDPNSKVNTGRTKEILGELDRLINPKNRNDVTQRESMKAVLGDQLYQDAITGKLMPEELKDMMGKNALACGVVQELVKMEAGMNVKGNPPIKAQLEYGRLVEVVEMVKNSQSFIENYRHLDLSESSPDYVRHLLKGGGVNKNDPEKHIPHPREVAQDIMKSYLSRQRQAAQNPPAAAQNPQAAPDPQVAANNQQPAPKKKPQNAVPQ